MVTGFDKQVQRFRTAGDEKNFKKVLAVSKGTSNFATRFEYETMQDWNFSGDALKKLQKSFGGLEETS